MMDAVQLLSTRRSVSARNMTEPGPSRAELEQILTMAARVPDHGKLTPWRFIVFADEARARAGAALAEVLHQRGEARDDEIVFAKNAFLRAPVVVAVVSTATEHPKIPMFEQLMSGAAAAMTLCHGAHALGYSANWLTDWFSTDNAAKARLGIQSQETVIGFIYLGSAKEAPMERPRPSLAEIVRYF